MFNRSCRWLVAAALLLSVAASARGQNAKSRLATFAQDGQHYFALSLMAGVPADAVQKNDIVVLVDTSASQVGRVRDEELAALRSLLAGLTPADRVQLMAVDMNAIPMSDGFVGAASPQMQAALAKLQQRTPLGATDLDAGLRTAMSKLSNAEGAKSVIYIGDAMSKANAFSTPSLKKLVADLRRDKVSVSGYVLGLERNGQLMAALANHTGGTAILDTTSPDASTLAGRALAAAARGSVVWTTEASLPSQIAESYPAEMPPLRTDRDTILVGTLKELSEVKLSAAGTLNGQPIEMTWQAAPEKSSEDFVFLPKLIELAKADGGLSLPTVGSAGLREAGLVMLNSAEQLAKLGHQALATGNFAGAETVATVALSRDPSNPEARAIRSAARKAASGAPVAAAEPELKLTSAVAPAPGSLLEEVLAEEPGFLNRVEADRRVRTGKIRAEVENALADARRLMGTSPEMAEQDLKVLMQSVEGYVDLDPDVRAQLHQQVENAIRQSRRIAVEVAERRSAAEAQRAAAIDMERLNRLFTVREQQLKQLMDRFDALMEEGRWGIADDEVALEVQKVAPGTSLASAAIFGSQLIRGVNENYLAKNAKEKNFLAALYQVELSLIPFPDEPPIIYATPERWQDLTRRREKYKAVDLVRPGGTEKKIFDELNKPTSIEFVEQPLKDVVLYLQENHGIPIVLASKRLEEASISPDTPITKNLKGITLRSALRLMLRELELTYVVREEVLQITTPEDAESQLITKVYPVGDLVVPVGAQSNLFGLGGMGGGMMGGGMGGGMGGMGGGMGGMGGGMGGMGGGMGGGMFAVGDDLTLGEKKSAAAEAAAPAEAPPAARATPKQVERLQVTASGNQSPAEAWNALFAAEVEKFAVAADSSAEAMFRARVRETVRALMRDKKYAEAAMVIQSALRSGLPEPWMYEAMALAMQLEGAPAEEVERALLSAVDFAENENQVISIAAYMAKLGLHKRALKLYQQVGNANPSRPEPFIQALGLAQRLEDTEGIQWATVGILSQAWTGDQKSIGENALHVAKATLEKLVSTGKKAEAEAFEAALLKANQRDCIVTVTWTGDADIDLSVAEPSGTTVSLRQPRSTSGGVHLGDASASAGKAAVDGISETYVCPEGFAGEYRVYLKPIWGRPTNGTVTVDLYTNYGTEKQFSGRKQIPVRDEPVLVTFDLKEGRRSEALPEAQVANVAQIQNATNRAILAQQIATATNSPASTSFAESLAAAQALGLGFLGRGAVGYRPVITQLPEGANFSTNAVISADRRYVRVSPAPTFSQVTDVNTFNFVTGSGQNQGNAGGTGGFGGGVGGGGQF